MNTILLSGGVFMKRFTLIVLAMCLIATSASAANFGVRGGLSVDPDQFHVGGHVDIGTIFEPIRFVPNLEVGFGDNTTLFAVNGDFLWDIPESSFYVGGEIAVNFFSYDNGRVDDSDSEVGLSALGGWNFQSPWLLELKFGLSHSPDFKATVGYTFF
jgi:hypothetical protein